MTTHKKSDQDKTSTPRTDTDQTGAPNPADQPAPVDAPNPVVGEPEPPTPAREKRPDTN